MLPHQSVRQNIEYQSNLSCLRFIRIQGNTAQILQEEVGQVFAKVLEHAGVYKRTEEGKTALLRFIAYVNC